jgi:hypothetical protein
MYNYWRFIFPMFAPNLNIVFILILDILEGSCFADCLLVKDLLSGSGSLVIRVLVFDSNEVYYNVGTLSSHPPAGIRN